MICIIFRRGEFDLVFCRNDGVYWVEPTSRPNVSCMVSEGVDFDPHQFIQEYCHMIVEFWEGWDMTKYLHAPADNAVITWVMQTFCIWSQIKNLLKLTNIAQSELKP